VGKGPLFASLVAFDWNIAFLVDDPGRTTEGEFHEIACDYRRP
jgi:hypothetical protein